VDRRRFLLTSLAGALAAPLAAEAQEADKIARIGYLAANLVANPRNRESFRQGLHDPLGVRLQFVEAREPADIDKAFSEMTRARAGALAVWGTVMFSSERRRLVDLAAKNRLPAVYTGREFVDAGGLMAYGGNVSDQFRRQTFLLSRRPSSTSLSTSRPRRRSASRSRRRCCCGRIR
jgi:hypothetical protein